MVGPDRRIAGSAEYSFSPGLSEQEYAALQRVVDTALAEDLAYGPDATSLATVPAAARTTATVTSRQPGVIAGLDTIPAVLTALGATDVAVTMHCHDGDDVAPGSQVATLVGPTRVILTAERTILNLLSHLSGIASETAAWAAEVAGKKARIRDSRKTLPGLRLLQKYAVRAGGGVNHRMGLGDAILIKDNHVAAAGGVLPALEAARREFPDLACEVEVDSLEQLDEMLAAGVDLVLLDNFPVWQTQIAVQRRDAVSPHTLLESSGGLSRDVAAEYAACGVDYLAVGALTHSVRALDLGLDF